MAPKSQPHPAGTESPSLPTAATSSKEGSEAPTSSKQSRNASPSSATGVPPKRADSETAPGKATSTSQPMVKSSSSSSGSNPPDAKDAATGPSPYGTRSRNRTGRARPNYAEDKDIDSDLFDAAPERRDDGDAKRSTRQANPSATTTQDSLQPGSSSSSSSTSRKPLPSSDDGKHGGSAVAATTTTTTTITTAVANKESQQQQQNQASASATPTPAANPPPAPQTSKKRKAGNQGSSSTLNQQNAPANASGSSGAAHRKSLGGGGGAGGASGYAETNMMSFEDCQGRPKNKTLTADDGTILAVNDHVYLICEPPGEPYYIARIMEFLHSKNDATRPVDSVRVNWFYRPKDIGRKAQDTRMLFATMHSDICPLNSLRGKCTVRHKAEIPNAEAYRRSPDCFWWDKMYDRYIQKNYDAIPTSQIINVPERVKKVLDERWKYILVEQGRGKELTSAVKSCKRCSGYCASADSVDCGFCKNTYHMQCVRPPLQKKPARGFGWACGPCNLAQERKLEALNAPHLHHDSASHVSGEDEELLEEEEEEDPAQANTNRTSPDVEHDHPPPTPEQIYQASLWPYRYLGMHCKLEDALDYDDRIYPRASSRLGPRHQATVGNWPGRPVQFVKPLEIKKTGRKDARHSKEIQALVEKDKREREQRPKWVQDEPFSGYVPRGLDLAEDDPKSTSTCLWKPAEDADGEPVKDADNDLIISEAGIDDYMDRARSMTKELGLPDRSTNLEDIARDLLHKNNYDAEESLRQLAKTDKSLFKEPELTAAEQKKFEEAVAKFGSELQSVKRHVKSVPHKWIVRHYYKWKKTAQGKKIWGNHPQRKGKKEIKRAQAEASKAADEVADDHDDSAFDTVKAKDRKKNFMCKFCSTKTSRQWRRAPNVSSAVVIETGGKNKDKGTPYVVALCRRCAELWRRYAIQWEDLDEAAKKLASSGNRSWKKKIDEELYKELQAADERMRLTKYSSPEPPVLPPNAAAASATQSTGPLEPPRKKLKSERDPEPTSLETGGVGSAAAAKKKEKEKPVEKPAPPPPPPMPKPKTMPCSICRQVEPLGGQHLQCRECRMTVHRNCYGVIDNRQNGRWMCDMCSNDKNPQISLHYKCVLCPVERTEHDFVEPPKISHKKKSEKERERERLEKESAQKAADFYRKLQEELGRPVDPREPLKRTADNNWVHVTCAVFTPEVKFANAKALEPSEGIPSIPRSRYQEVCKVCKQQGGACVPCHNPTCRMTFHVECAYQQGYAVGFDITPVKGSRRDQHNIVSIGGESGTMTAAIWCKDHVPKSVIHHIEDVVDESGLNALQLYVRNFKQADLALTGCARKANLIPAAARPVTASTTAPVNRRASTTTLVPATSPIQVNGAIKEEVPYIMQPAGKVCITCGTDVSPKWHSIDESQGLLLVNGHGGSLGEEAQKFVAQRNYQCHKCKKANRRVEPQPAVKQEASPPPVEVVRSPPPAIQATASPQNLMSVRNIAPQPWDRPPRQPSLDAPATQPPPMAATSHGPAFGPPPAPLSVQAPAPIAPPIAPSMLQAPQQQTQPPPLAQPIAAPSLQSALPPRGPPSHQFPPPHTPPYGEWRRPSSRHGSHPPPPLPPSQSHHMNGAHTQMPPSTVAPLAPPNHLRPPPLSGIPPPPPPLHNGHGPGHHYGPQPVTNGMPPSPRGMGGPPPIPNGGPYLAQHHQPHSVHHQPPPPPHHLTNGGPPPRAAEHTFSHGLHPQRSPFSTPHGSPPVARDTVMVGRETSMPPRAPDTRQPSGASASPSLRNLLH